MDRGDNLFELPPRRGKFCEFYEPNAAPDYGSATVIRGGAEGRELRSERLLAL